MRLAGTGLLVLALLVAQPVDLKTRPSIRRNAEHRRALMFGRIVTIAAVLRMGPR